MTQRTKPSKLIYSGVASRVYAGYNPNPNPRFDQRTGACEGLSMSKRHTPTFVGATVFACVNDAPVFPLLLN